MNYRLLRLTIFAIIMCLGGQLRAQDPPVINVTGAVLLCPDEDYEYIVNIYPAPESGIEFDRIKYTMQYVFCGGSMITANGQGNIVLEPELGEQYEPIVFKLKTKWSNETNEEICGRICFTLNYNYFLYNSNYYLPGWYASHYRYSVEQCIDFRISPKSHASRSIVGAANPVFCNDGTERYCASDEIGKPPYQWTLPPGLIIVGPINERCIEVARDPNVSFTGGTINVRNQASNCVALTGDIEIKAPFSLESSCLSGCDGSCKVYDTVIQGNPPFTFSDIPGATKTVSADGRSVIYSNLSSCNREYTTSVTDANGCTMQKNVLLSPGLSCMRESRILKNSTYIESIEVLSTTPCEQKVTINNLFPNALLAANINWYSVTDVNEMTSLGSTNICTLNAPGRYVVRILTSDGCQYYKEIELSSCPITIDPNGEGIQAIYPNPAHNYINIDIRNIQNNSVDIKIKDISGNVKISRNFGVQPSGVNTYQIDISSLAPNNYVLITTIGNNIPQSHAVYIY